MILNSLRMNIKLIVLFFILKAVMFSNLLWSETTGENSIDYKRLIQNIPKFKKIIIINTISNYNPTINVNEGVETGSKKEAVKTEISEDHQMFTVESKDGIAIAALRLGLKDKKGNLIASSENKTVFWANAEADKANDLEDLMGNEIKGVNVSLKRSPEDGNTLIITIKKDDGKSKNK